jgi:hypothetical protein
MIYAYAVGIYWVIFALPSTVQLPLLSHFVPFLIPSAMLSSFAVSSRNKIRKEHNNI